MTPYEIELANALWCCSFVPGSSQKRFCRNMAEIARNKPEQELSLRQRHYMELMAWRYRRQLPERFIPEKKPLDLPAPIKPLKEPRQKIDPKNFVPFDGPQADLFGKFP